MKRPFILWNLPIFLFLLVLSSHKLSGQAEISDQKEVNLYAGFGFPEFINVGVRYQLEQLQFGIGIGSIPMGEDDLIVATTDIYFHFAGSSRLSQRRPWFGRIGLLFHRWEDQRRIDKYIYFNPRIGREFNFSKKLGVAIDLGAVIELSHTQIDKEPSNGWGIELIDLPVLPAAGVTLFLRL